MELVSSNFSDETAFSRASQRDIVIGVGGRVHVWEDLEKAVSGRQPEPRSFHTMTAVGMFINGLTNNRLIVFSIASFLIVNSCFR